MVFRRVLVEVESNTADVTVLSSNMKGYRICFVMSYRKVWDVPKLLELEYSLRETTFVLYSGTDDALSNRRTAAALVDGQRLGGNIDAAAACSMHVRMQAMPSKDGSVRLLFLQR